MPGALYGAREHSLMLGACAGLSPWFDLSTIRDVPAQPSDILVINDADAIHAEMTNLAPWEVAVASTAPSAKAPSGWTATLSAISRSGSSAFAFFCHV